MRDQNYQPSVVVNNINGATPQYTSGAGSGLLVSVFMLIALIWAAEHTGVIIAVVGVSGMSYCLLRYFTQRRAEQQARNNQLRSDADYENFLYNYDDPRGTYGRNYSQGKHSK